MLPRALRTKWVAIGLGVAATGLFAATVAWPIHKEIAGLKRELKSRRTFIDEADSQTIKTAAVEARLAQVEEYLGEWRSRLAAEGNSAVPLDQITEMAKSTGVTIAKLTPAPAVEYERLAEVPVALELQGEFGDLMRLLAGIESLPAVAWVKDLRLAPVGQDQADLGCDVTLALFADDSEYSD